MNTRKRILTFPLAYFVLLFVIAPVNAEEQSFDKVVIQLKWFHQFQFAGYYAAKHKGFYEDYGLDVHIRELNSESTALEEVTSGRANFGIGDTSLIIEAAGGQNIKALAAIFQYNPQVLVSKKSSGIVSPFELQNKRIMFESGVGQDALVRALLEEASLSTDNFTHVPHSYNNDDLISGNVDAISVNLTDQIYYFRDRGVDINVISPLSYRFDFYGDILFTSQSEVELNPERVEAFRNASLKGWEYALENSEEIIQLIKNEYKSRLSLDHLRYEAKEAKKLILPDKLPVGTILHQRLKRVAEIYHQLGISEPISEEQLKAFVYEKEATLTLTDEEKRWLKNHPVINVGIDADYAPFEWLDENNEHKGITAEYLQLFEDRLGVKFEVIKGLNWQQTLDQIGSGKLDMLTDANMTYQRLAYLNFTDVYIESPVVIVSDIKKGYIGSLKNLYGKKVAMELGYFMQEMLIRDHTEIELILTENEMEALTLVNSGQADAYVGDGISLNFYIEKLGLSNLRLSGSTSYSSHHRMAVIQMHPELLSILQKLLEQMGQRQHQAIFHHWLGLTIKQGWKTETVMKYLVASLVIFFIFSFYLIKLRRSKRALATSEQKLNDILKNIDVFVYLKNLDGKYLYANQQVCDLWGMTLEQIIGNSDEMYFDELSTKKIQHKDKQVLLNGRITKDEESNILKETGKTSTYLSTRIPLKNDHGDIYALLGVSTDITKVLNTEKREKRRNNILELLTRNSSLKEILTQIVYDIEDELTGATVSILLVDKSAKYLTLGAAPNLPDFYNEAVDGMPIAEDSGSCGAAVFSGQLVIVDDIQSHENWTSFADLAREANLAACWSQPIKTATGEVLGALAIYHDNSYYPEKDEIFQVEQMAHLAGIAIEKSKFNKDLLSQKELLQVLIDEFPDVLVMKNWEGKFILANKNIADLYNTTPQQMIGKDDGDFTGDRQQADFFLKNVQEIMNKFKTEVVYEDSSDVKTGEVRHFKSIKKPLRNENGSLQILIIAQDITEIVRSKNEAEKLSNQLNYVLSATNEGVWDWNLETNQVSHNQQWFEIMGVDKKQATETYQDYIERLVPEDKDLVEAAIQQCLDNKSAFQSEHRQIKDNGDIIWVYSRGQVVERNNLGQPVRMVGSTSDITERKLAEFKVIENEQLLRTSIDAIGEAFVIFDTDDNIAFYNDKYKQIYASSPGLIQQGRSFQEILKTGCDQGLYVDAIGRESQWLEEHLALHNQQSSELIQELNDGRWISLRERKTPTGYSVGFRADITELYLAKQAADEANKAKGQFLATMSHEIRTPMNGVLGMAQLLEDTELDDEQKDYLEVINQSGNNLLAIINDILDFSKLDSEMTSLERTEFSLRQLGQDSINMLKVLAANKQLNLHYKYIDDSTDYYIGDPTRIRQILINLLSNAIKFTREHGQVSLSISLNKQSDKMDTIQFCVSDNGIGIEQDQLDKLFDEFTQADQATTRQYGGTGLGLAICKKLVTLMQGSITVQSTIGEGSEFTISLPIEKSHHLNSDNSQTEIFNSAQKNLALTAKILVVEDVLPNQIIARKFIENFGCQVELADNGEQAIEFLKSKKFDMILMDCRMPVMDGYEATRNIRQIEKDSNTDKHIPIIALTANASDNDRKECKDAGMDDFLSKPFKREELYQVITKWKS